MRENEKVRCPACGETTVAKRRKCFEGFRPVGEELACALCGARLGSYDAESAEVPENRTDRKLAALLGADAPPKKPTLHREESEGHFCRDCVHYVKHPFLSRCSLRQMEVAPMDDCPEWRAPETKTKAPN